MAYEKIGPWADGPGGGTPVDAVDLDHMEDGIEAAHDTVDAHIADETDPHGLGDTAELVADVDAATAAAAALALFRGNGIAFKVWDAGTSAYVWLSGSDPGTEVGIVGFIDPTGANDPETADGGTGDAYTWWLKPAA